MFADLLSMNFCGAFHVKHRLAFLFLDKLANLMALFSDGAKNEIDCFKTLLSSKTGERIAAIIRKGTRRRNVRLSELLDDSVRLTYKRIHDHVALRTDNPDIKEDQRLAHLRTLRNLGHGTYLRGQKFEETFLGGSPTIPSELAYVPLLIALALGLNPQEVLRNT